MVPSIRPAELDDCFAMQNTNLHCLPENYTLKYYWYHHMCWPQNLFVAEDDSVVGYVLAKMDEEVPQNGHITSISVLRSHRKLGIAQKLMLAAHGGMQSTFKAEACTLHVRASNRPAFSLYTGLQYSIALVDQRYYADQEDAFKMERRFSEAAVVNKRVDSC